MNEARSRGCGFVARSQQQPADDEPRVRKQQRRRLARFPWSQQAAGMVEMQMREHDDIDVLVRKAGCLQRIEQHMPRLDDAVAFTQFRLEKRADAGLETARSWRRRSSTRSARQASGMRLSASGATHFSHIPLGTLPNMAPPSSRCELPMIDQSFIKQTVLLDHAAAAGSARICTGVYFSTLAIPAHHIHEAPGVPASLTL